MLDEILRRARGLPVVEQLQLAAEAGNAAELRIYESRGLKVFGVEQHALFVNGRYYDEKHLQLFFHGEPADQLRR
jgi:RimJ/RimL family protein N-acetyltransferase